MSLTTVYKANGSTMEVNDHMLPILGKLNLSIENPVKSVKKKKVKKQSES